MLRFAPIIRVSTEQQEKRGESLKVQKEQIIQYVKQLNGVIPDYCWQYTGQESATSGHERKLLEKLLEDSSKDLFDAVICVDPSRWSRDNQKSKEGLEILRQNNIRFFMGLSESDLFDPTSTLFLGMSAEIGEYQAKIQSRKSAESRISRLSRNIPASGALPYGRTYNRDTGEWGIDKEKKKLIEIAAERYLKGEGFTIIGKSLGFDPGHLWRILTQRCGTEWVVHISNKKNKIEKTHILTIPPLLDEVKIQEIKDKSQKNITYVRGNRKHPYLLQGMIYCRHCGRMMNAVTNIDGKRIYRHSQVKEGERCFKHQVKADEIENIVLVQVTMAIGDPERMKAAIEKATPDMSKIEGLRQERDLMTEELRKTGLQIRNLAKVAAKGLMSDEDIKEENDSIKEKEGLIKARIKIIDDQLENLPEPERIKRLSKLGLQVLASVLKTPTKHLKILDKPFAWKRNLMEKAFSGKDMEGKRLGVYVDYVNGHVEFEIHGGFESTLTALPLSDDYIEKTFRLDWDYEEFGLNYADIKDQQRHEINKVRMKLKSNLRGKCRKNALIFGQNDFIL